MSDLTPDNIPNAVAIIAEYPAYHTCPRFHARDAPQHGGMEARLDFLVEVGQLTTDVRNESLLLSDVLGLSLLVDSIDHPKPDNLTKGSVLGPFHTHDALEVPHGDPISFDDKGQPHSASAHGCLGDGQQWFYDLQHSDRSEPAGRAGLSGQALRCVRRKVADRAPSPLATGPYALYVCERWLIDPDPYLRSDAVFEVKSGLIVKWQKAPEELANHCDISQGIKLLTNHRLGQGTRTLLMLSATSSRAERAFWSTTLAGARLKLDKDRELILTKNTKCRN
ncbi:uncharacterized protein NECHADRAFT_97681 [Fusarium vanettenii 77-13-4]|uniref:Catechol dioxygenase N-terminal domain-containing protein n=1 Tax=Fusarium vanettenii (strain ATCC MYA-4622 / CBS 123669 / FGSC 9596 / NRRL 45880 / 77-13-4) TaxID=660122 RepID=C7ZEH8_FUSV7|nr:uncharacterized protein NECHADRAFT_97681 [Fusarium vanettenii 77-13-4]EEU37598.1 hypothetical protein NECHADRAFT_97681 [Fusarium vanettenii 77-13-4]